MTDDGQALSSTDTAGALVQAELLADLSSSKQLLGQSLRCCTSGSTCSPKFSDTHGTPSSVDRLFSVKSVSAINSMFARLGTNYEIRNQCFFAILEAMTTD